MSEVGLTGLRETWWVDRGFFGDGVSLTRLFKIYTCSLYKQNGFKRTDKVIFIIFFW